MRTSGNPALILAVFQLLNILTYGFFVLGDANRYLLCLGMDSSSSSSGGVIGRILFLPFFVIGIVHRLFNISKSLHVASSTSLFLAPVRSSIGMMYLRCMFGLISTSLRSRLACALLRKSCLWLLSSYSFTPLQGL